MATQPITKTLDKRSWEEFRANGMLFAVNTFLHFFGWSIAVDVDSVTKEVVKVYPCRTKYRGFSTRDQSEDHQKIANYLANNAPNFPEEIK